MRNVRSVLLHLLVLCSFLPALHGWEWSDYLMSQVESKNSEALTYTEVSAMKASRIKRRLTRKHGYGADEVNRMIDKQELINALAFEEHKLRSIERDELMRSLVIKTCIAAFVVGVVVWTWPIWTQLYDMVSVNIVVYTDRKTLEMRRCLETQSVLGGVGIFLMLLLDLLQAWLTVSVLLSWVMVRKWYFFPTPSISIQPAQLMGGPIAQGPLGGYGVNIGPMLITWLLRFLYSRLERMVGQALLQSQKRQQKQRRANETPAEKAARKAAKRKRKQEQREAQAQAQAQWRQQQQQHYYSTPFITEATTTTTTSSSSSTTTARAPPPQSAFMSAINPTTRLPQPNGTSFSEANQQSNQHHQQPSGSEEWSKELEQTKQPPPTREERRLAAALAAERRAATTTSTKATQQQYSVDGQNGLEELD